MIVYEDADTRGFWSPHGEEVIYVGPAREKYRCYKLYCPATKAIRIVKTVKFLPQNCKVLGNAPTDQLAIAATELTDAIRDISDNKVVDTFPIKTVDVLNTLREMFTTTVGDSSNNEEYNGPTLSLNPTSAQLKYSMTREPTHR